MSRSNPVSPSVVAAALAACLLTTGPAAGAPFIAEFVADNASSFVDADGDASDWIEIFNPDAVAVNLDGWYLTDTAATPAKWRFPAVSLPAGGRLVVFASSKNRAVAGQELHTNFALASGGEYLALVQPDGVSVASEFAPAFPAQAEDVAYGTPQQVVTTTVTATALPRWRVPASAGDVPADWAARTFDDAAWTTAAAPGGIGYDADQANASPEVNLARTGSPAPVATQSTTTGAFAASLGIDGDASNFTHTLGTDSAASWTVDLQRRAAVKEIVIGNRTSCCGSRLRDIAVDVLAADNSVLWTTPALLNPENQLGVYPNGPTSLTVDFSAILGGPLLGNKVRIRRIADPDLSGTAGQGNTDEANVLSLGEVTVTGMESLGYRAYIATDVQTAMQGQNASLFARVPFTVADPGTISSLKLDVRYDDGFVAWLNGVKIAERNAPASPAWNSAATTDRSITEGSAQETIDLGAHVAELVAGTNVLAIQALNSSAADANFLIQPQLSYTTVSVGPVAFLETPTPGALNDSTWYLGKVADTDFSVKRGYYDTPQTVAVTSATEGAQIWFTTDGSDPSPANGTLYSAPLTISGTTVLRVRAYKPDWKPTNIDTSTYIFIGTPGALQAGDVLNQSPTGAAPGAGWAPPGTSSTNGQWINYGMDPRIVNRYSAAQWKEAFSQVPTLSLVTPVANLFNASTGIYVNALSHGEDWERPASVEMMDPTKPAAEQTEFQHNVGVRIRGGYSRNDAFPKHSFRVFFRSTYGTGRLRYPLYGSAGANEFDTFDLRGSTNYSWANDGGSGSFDTMLRDPFSRSLLGAMGSPHTRSRFCHLFLNGQYWGIYEIHERAEAAYGETYLGGNKDDYDVVKCANHGGNPEAGIPAFGTEATDGDLVAWQQLWNLCRDVYNAPTNENYFKVLGRNPDGTRNPALPVLLDVDSLIDYMLAIFYSGDGDATLSSFLENNRANNWFGMRNRTADRGFVFFNHDAEHTFNAPSWGADRTGPWGGSNQFVFTYSNPQWFHEELMRNKEYRLRFADHVQRHFFNGGPLTGAVASASFQGRAATINRAIRAYSARWGDTTGNSGANPRYDENTWNSAISTFTTAYFTSRNTTVLNQLRTDGLYPVTAAPVFSQRGGDVAAGYPLSLTGPAGSVIYYTTDGTDPRMLRSEPPTPFVYSAENAPVRWHVTTAVDDGFTPVNITPGPLGKWALDNNALDAAGTANGTLVGGPTYVAGKVGTHAISLNGTSQYVNLGNPAALQFTGQITLAAWIYPTASNGLRNIVAKGYATSPSSGEIVLRVNGGAIEVGSWNGANHIASAAGAATLNEWQHVVGVHNGTQWKLYRNGVEIASLTDSVGAVTVGSGWAIGARGAVLERLFAGRIDDVQIYNRGLTPEEVQLLYGGGSGYVPAWHTAAFTVPATWGTATGPLGFDAGAGNAYGPLISTDLLAPMRNVSPTVLTRREFTLTAQEKAATATLQLRVRHDDGFIAWLNGVKIAERNAPALPDGLTPATAAHDDAEAVVEEKFDVSTAIPSLVAGTNVLSIQGFNLTAGDDDFLLAASLHAGDATPDIGPGTQVYTGPIALTTSQMVQARAYNPTTGDWSALDGAFFTVDTDPADATNLVISEIHYNPTGPTLAEQAVADDGDDFEFIELANISARSIDLSGVAFDAGIEFTFVNTVLAPGARIVLASDAAAFAARYGFAPAGVYGGNLANGGEFLSLRGKNGAPIREFAYSDAAPWPEAADGAGPSLTLVDPASNPDHALPGSWRASTAAHGTPGATDATSYAAWKSSLGISDDAADGDGDGLGAFAEYAFGGNPATADAPRAQPTLTAAGDAWLVTVPRRTAADDVRLIVETSVDLVTWSSEGVTLAAVDAQGDVSLETWAVPPPATVPTQRYVRCRAVTR